MSPFAQEKIESRMLLFKEFLVAKLEDKIRRKISYDAVSPSIFRSLEISNLKISDEKSSRPLLSVGKCKVHYNLFSLLFGHVEEALREIVLENVSVVFDAEEDADIFSGGGGGGFSEILSRLREDGLRTRITGRNINWYLKSRSGELAAEKIFFQLRPEGGAYSIQLRGGLSYRGAGRIKEGGAAVDLRGTLNPSLTDGEATLGLSGLKTNLFDMRRQVFQVSFSPEDLRLRKIQDRTPLDFSLSYTHAAKEVGVRFFSQNFRPSDLVVMKSDLAFLNEWLQTAFSSRGDLIYGTAGGTLAYTLDFDADIQNPRLPAGLRFSGKAEGTRDFVRFSPLGVSGAYGRASFRGDLPFSTLYPAGDVRVENFTLLGPETLNAAFKLSRTAAGVELAADTLSWGELDFLGVRAGMENTPAALLVNARFGFASDGEAEMGFRCVFPKNRETARFLISLKDTPVEILRAPLSNYFPESPLPGIVPLLGGADVRVTGSVSGENGTGGLSFSVPDISVFRKSDSGAYTLNVSGSYSPQSWEIENWNLRWGRYSGQGNASGKLLPQGRLSFTSSVNMMDIAYNFGGTFDPGGHLHIDGSRGMTIDMRWRPGGDCAGIFRLDNFPVPMPYDVMRISSAASFRYASPASWSVETNMVSIRSFAPFAHIKADMDFGLELGPGGGTLHSLRYTDAVSTLTGGGKITYSANPVRAAGEFSLDAGEVSVEQYSLSAVYAGEAFAGNLVFTEAPLERFSARDITGDLSGSLDFSGLPESPQGKISLRSSGVRINAQPAFLNFEAALENKVFSVSALDAAYGTLRLSDTLVEYSLPEETLSLAALLHKDSGRETVTWFLGGGLAFAGPGKEAAGDGENAPPVSAEAFFRWLVDSSLRGQLQLSTPSPRVPPEFRSLTFSVEKEGRDTRVSGGAGDSLDAVFRETGNFSVSVKAPFPVTFEAEGFFTSGELEANINRVSFLAEDFAWLLNFGMLHLTRGNATGNLRVTGTPFDPDIYGTLAVMDGYANLDVMPDELGPYRGNIIFREKYFAVQPMIVPAGAGWAEVSAEFQIDRLKLASLSVLVDTKDGSGVRIAQNFSGIAVDGNAQGVLRVSGDLRNLHVDGDITASHTVVTSGEKSPPPPVPKTLFTSVDMKIETGSGVEILLPTADFPILQTFAERGEHIAFQWEEETEDFRLTGEVRARGGEIFWFDRRFFIREGFARFNERTGSFDPFVSMRAELRETTSDGLVRIYLISDLVPASSFSPRFESDRGYTNAEILAVLGTNPFGTRGEESSSMSITSAVPFAGDILAQIGVVKTMEKSIRDIFHLDLFSVRTHVVQNVLQNVVSPNRDQEESMRERDRYRETPTFGRYLDKTSLFLGKYIGRDLFLNFLLQFRAQDLYVREEDTIGGVVLDAEFVLEWHTPFFNLEWSLMPQHPDELFILDNVLTFRWRFAF